MNTALKKTARGVFKLFGLEPVPLPKRKTAYEHVHPQANYTPWNLDSDFRSVYGHVQQNTLVDIYRCWELWTLVGQTAKLDGDIIEVGVWRGGTGALMAKRAAGFGGNDRIYLCDTFEGVVKAGSPDPVYKGGEHSDTSQRVVEDLLRSVGVNNARVLKGIFPDQTAYLIESDVRFRLCHIDVDVYQSAKDCMAWIWDRMVAGGIVVYDDYGFRGTEGITQYVNEQAAESDRLVLHNLNGHALVVKTAAGARSLSPA